MLPWREWSQLSVAQGWVEPERGPTRFEAGLDLIGGIGLLTGVVQLLRLANQGLVSVMQLDRTVDGVRAATNRVHPALPRHSTLESAVSSR